MDPQASRSAHVLRGPYRAFAVRAAVLPITAISSLLTIRIVVEATGVSGYAIFALITGLPALLPIADLGIAAAVTDAVARRVELGPEHVRRVLRSSVRKMIAASLTIMGISIALAATDGWQVVLGAKTGNSLNAAATASLIAFAAGLPFVIGHRILLGLGRNHISVLIQAAMSLLTLLALLVLKLAETPLWLFTTAPMVVAAFGGIAAGVIGDRTLHLRLLKVMQSAFARQEPGIAIWALAAPMMVIMAATPLAYQSDRLVLSHVSNIAELARYSAGAQLFTPALSLISTAGLSLWPVFAQARSKDGSPQRSQLVHALYVFAGVGGILAVLLTLVGPPVSSWATNSGAGASPILMAAFGLLLIVHASYYPAAMFLTDGVGLRFQAIRTVAMMLLNIPLSIVLASWWGAPGPLIASSAAIICCMWIPGVRKSLAQAG